MQGSMRIFIPMLGLTLLGLVAAVPAPGNQKLHERMTVEELKQIFNTEPHAVPEYDVVPIHWPRLQKRSQQSGIKIRLNAFGRNIKLFLNPTDGILFGKDTPVYLAKTDKKAAAGLKIFKVTNAMDTVNQLLEDKEKKASLLVKRSASGGNLISGLVLSEGWVVKPLPERLRNELNSRYRRSIDENKNRTIGDGEPEHHLIFKSPEPSEKSNYVTLPIPDNAQSLDSRSKRSSPNIVYPQVLVFVTYETYKLYGEYMYDLLEYLVPFWNGVDLRYRGLEFPKVRLNIAGVVVANDETALSFEADNVVGPGSMNILGALDSLGRYMPNVNHYFPNDTWDIAVAMAPYTMCYPNDEGLCETGTLGLAYLSGACTFLNYKIRKTLAVSVITDKGGYDGMHTAAHEIGHLLGAPHDGEDGSSCTAEQGNIMAPSPQLSVNSSDWSTCTLKNFNKFFNVDDPKCLYNKPKTTSSVTRLLPGKLMSLDQQCKMIEGTKACPLSENMCVNLQCIYKANPQYCTNVGDASADGSPCGEGKICLHGQCLVEKDFD